MFVCSVLLYVSKELFRDYNFKINTRTYMLLNVFDLLHLVKIHFWCHNQQKILWLRMGNILKTSESPRPRIRGLLLFTPRLQLMFPG